MMAKEFDEAPVGSEKSQAYVEVVHRLNEIFNEQWDTGNMEGALNGVEVAVNSMAVELTDGVDHKQLRLACIQMAIGSKSPTGTFNDVVSAASIFEDYIKNGAAKP